jgi:hypothetical protein
MFIVSFFFSLLGVERIEIKVNTRFPFLLLLLFHALIFCFKLFGFKHDQHIYIKQTRSTYIFQLINGLSIVVFGYGHKGNKLK